MTCLECNRDVVDCLCRNPEWKRTTPLDRLIDCRCQGCGAGFKARRDADLCPSCASREAAADASLGGEPLLPMEAPKYSTAWNQEYLGVNGHEDV